MNMIEIEEFIDDGDMGYNSNKALIDLDRVVSITGLNNCYRGKKRLQVGAKEILISEQDAEKLFDILSLGKKL